MSDKKELTEEELQTMVILAVREGVLSRDVARIMTVENHKPTKDEETK